MEQVRNKMNEKGAKGYKVNISSSTNGRDMTLLDRADVEMEKKRNKDLIATAFNSRSVDERFVQMCREDQKASINCVPETSASPKKEFGEDWLRIKQSKKT